MTWKDLTTTQDARVPDEEELDCVTGARNIYLGLVVPIPGEGTHVILNQPLYSGGSLIPKVSYKTWRFAGGGIDLVEGHSHAIVPLPDDAARELQAIVRDG